MFKLSLARFQNYPITYLLIAFNCLVYLYICAQVDKPFLSSFFDGPGYDTLLLYGAKENSLIALGQIYRVFLPMFIHANFVHLIVNMIGLLSVGRIFETIAGHRHLFILYLVAGITGNLCSFAILPHLSVGASGSLFGILLCLYVIQKYQEKLNKQFKNDNVPYKFGNIILINGLLNILFGITFPIFDWACHLGGSIAGILFGFAIVTKHSWRVRLFTHVSGHLDKIFQDKLPQKKFFEHHIIYYIGILLINLSFSLAVFKIEKYQKIAGMGAYAAAQNPTKPLNYDDLVQYKDMLISRNKETSPDNLLYGAYVIFQHKDFFASYKLFSILDELKKHNFVSQSMDSKMYFNLIEQGLHFSEQDTLSTEDFASLQLKQTLSYNKEEDYCAKPANLFMTLGFFEIAGNLYECAYALNIQNDSYALKAFESFHIIKNEAKMNEILTLVKSYSN